MVSDTFHTYVQLDRSQSHSHPPSASHSPIPTPVTSSHISTQSTPRRSLPAPPIDDTNMTVPASEQRSSHSPSQVRAAREPIDILRNGIGPATVTNEQSNFKQQRGVAEPPVTHHAEEEADERRDSVLSKDYVRESEESEMDGHVIRFKTESETETEPNAERDDAPSPIVNSSPASPSNPNGDSAIDADNEDDDGDTSGEYIEGQIVINDRTPPNNIISEYRGLCEQLTLEVESAKEARKREKREKRK